MKIALVTGANRGIGREIVRQLAEKKTYKIIATGRDINKVSGAVKELENVVPMKLDMTLEEDARNITASIEKEFGKLDVLINNAGIMGSVPMKAMDMVQVRQVMETNFFGPMQLAKHLLGLLKKSSDGRIINMSSGMGDLSGMMSGGYGAYRLSKWGLNGFTMLLGSELSDTNIKVFAMCPGWVRTDMGGAGASRSVEQGADTAVWLATSDKAETMKFYRDRKVIPW